MKVTVAPTGQRTIPVGREAQTAGARATEVLEDAHGDLPQGFGWPVKVARQETKGEGDFEAGAKSEVNQATDDFSERQATIHFCLDRLSLELGLVCILSSEILPTARRYI